MLFLLFLIESKKKKQSYNQETEGSRDPLTFFNQMKMPSIVLWQNG